MGYLDDMRLKMMKNLNENIYPSSGGSATFVVYTTKSVVFATNMTGIHTLYTLGL